MEPSYKNIEPTTPVPASDIVYALFVCDYGDPHFSFNSIYTSEEAANQAKDFYINPAPNHTEAYVEAFPLNQFHPGGELREWKKENG